jgi:hypothetical protein
MPTNPTVPTPNPPAPKLARRPSGPLARYLLHPGATTARLAHHVAHVAAHVAAVAGPAALAVLLGALAVLGAARAAGRRRMTNGARPVEILTPPEVDPEGAATLWTNLVALLRPAWRRVLCGQPHLSFELVATCGGLRFAIWVPGGIPPGMVERAVEAAWPGARTETRPAGPPLGGEGFSTGGSLTLALGEEYPLRHDHKVDPLRPLLGALAALAEGESACVQILARPVTGRRLARLHCRAVCRRAGRPTSPLARLLDLATPGPAARPAEVDRLKRKRQAIKIMSRYVTDRTGSPRPAAGSAVAYELRSVAVPFGNCIEPSNVKAGGKACPIRFQCAGCGFYRPDPSYLPVIEEHINALRADKETAAAMDADEFVVSSLADQASAFGAIAQSMRDRLATLPDDERDEVEAASAVLRKMRAGRNLIAVVADEVS